MLQLMMIMMKVMADVDADDEDNKDGDEMKNNDVYEGETEVEDYHTPYIIKTSVDDSDDDDDHKDNDEQHHLWRRDSSNRLTYTISMLKRWYCCAWHLEQKRTRWHLQLPLLI